MYNGCLNRFSNQLEFQWVLRLHSSGYLPLRCALHWEKININPLSPELTNLIFQPLEVVSRYRDSHYRDSQLQVTENLCYLCFKI